jgi:hypothetical protein
MPRRESAFVMGIAPLDVGGMFGEVSRGVTGQEFYSILYASALQNESSYKVHHVWQSFGALSRAVLLKSRVCFWTVSLCL